MINYISRSFRLFSGEPGRNNAFVKKSKKVLANKEKLCYIIKVAAETTR